MSFSVQLPTYQVEPQTDITLYPSHTEANNHYQKFQIQDVFEQMDIAEDFTRGAAMKYLFRFGKKEGKNKKDLLKCMHYLCLLYHYAFKAGRAEK